MFEIIFCNQNCRHPFVLFSSCGRLVFRGKNSATDRNDCYWVTSVLLSWWTDVLSVLSVLSIFSLVLYFDHCFLSGPLICPAITLACDIGLWKYLAITLACDFGLRYTLWFKVSYCAQWLSRTLVNLWFCQAVHGKSEQLLYYFYSIYLIYQSIMC